ncbi:MAG: hypothetical protein QOJ00_2029 [Actinomycetota bacterium]
MTAMQILFGVLLGRFVADNNTFSALATLGVLVLLLEVGLSTDLAELRAVGRASVSVAAVGIVTSFLGGAVVLAAFGYETHTVLFGGAALTATSVGIAARLWRNPTVLGAAIVDDLVGLVVLTAAAAAVGGAVTPLNVVWRLNLVGAFAIGLAVARSRWHAGATHAVERIGVVLVPMFFIHVGMTLDLDRAGQKGWLLGASLFGVAALAKMLAGAVAPEHRLRVGLGMLPRGEVTLVFAALGLREAVIGQDVYAALVIVVVATSLTAALALRQMTLS